MEEILLMVPLLLSRHQEFGSLVVESHLEEAVEREGCHCLVEEYLLVVPLLMMEGMVEGRACHDHRGLGYISKELILLHLFLRSLFSQMEITIFDSTGLFGNDDNAKEEKENRGRLTQRAAWRHRGRSTTRW